MTLKLVGRVSALAIATAALGACATTGDTTPMSPLVPAASVPATAYVNDPHSWARPAEARVTHVDLDLAAVAKARSAIPALPNARAFATPISIA